MSSFPQDCWLHTETMDQVCLVGKRFPEIVQLSGQISSRPHTTDFPQMVVKSKGNHGKSPYFSEI